ncbi:MAG: thioredoxin [Acaryochloridaceae cyanobacterium SU_2_1]|nr:thioredoxin [Acaryochloridaceae cyanobacterium SU_2_1]NJM95739.1 thioredoxin [Acaryochloridaceae cyanobacterium CSU_5_19]
MATKKQFKNFAEMLAGSDVPLLVDFYATWCGPCRMLVPILDQVGALMRGQLQVVKIDTERYPELASTYEIHALPTLVLFKEGEVLDRIEGVLPPEDIISRLQPLLK